MLEVIRIPKGMGEDGPLFSCAQMFARKAMQSVSLRAKKLDNSHEIITIGAMVLPKPTPSRVTCLRCLI
jgi:hypothetical protein